MFKIPTGRQVKTLFFWLFFTYISLLLIVCVVFFYQGGEISEIWNVLKWTLTFFFRKPLFYLIWITPYLIFKLIMYFKKIYLSFGWKVMLKRIFLLLLLPAGAFFGAFKGVSWYNLQEDFEYIWNPEYENSDSLSLNLYAKDGKHRGIHLFTRGDREGDLKSLVKHHVEWVTLVPYTFQPDVLAPKLNFEPREVYNWRDSFFVESIIKAKEKNLNVLMKPHIWVEGDLWRSEIAMKTDAEWNEWFKQYEAFITHYAVIGEKTGCEALCIGTELMKSALQRPDNWRKLIKSVRKIYSGKLMYAANWDREYKEIDFWDELDYIGVQAYFGLSSKSNPTVEEICEGWEKHKTAMYKVHKKWDKPIIFTEVGYKSTMGAADKPWQWESSFGSLANKVSLETQANCYDALFTTFWNEPWFAGVHLWRWEGTDKFDFTPKEKPAANVMAKWFGKVAD